MLKTSLRTLDRSGSPGQLCPQSPSPKRLFDLPAIRIGAPDLGGIRNVRGG
jgi:hypothetical protein